MHLSTQLVTGIVNAIVLAAIARRLRLLTTSGALAAVFVGVTAFGVGGLSGAVPLLTFFISANVIGRWRRAKKEALGFEKGGERDAAQVIANGGVASMALLLGAFWPSQDLVAYVVFAACLAEANADTWATEIGAASFSIPVLITTGRPVEPGRSGGISLPGTVAALAGSSLIALVSLAWMNGGEVVVVGVTGFAGAMIDSALGATIQAHYRDGTGRIGERDGEHHTLVSGVRGIGNDAVNLLGTLSAGFLAAFFVHLIHTH